MDVKKCEECGTENPVNADFCQQCGKKLLNKPANDGNFFSKYYNNWNKKSNKYKIFTGLIGCCIGVFIIIMILAAIFPTTALSLDDSTINIDNQTTTYTLKGSTEPGATVKINSKDLNLTDVSITPSADGKFEYTLQIPTSINESEVTVTAKVSDKSQNQATATINRPKATETTSQNTDTSDDKTFSGQGLTFKYPNSWSIDEGGSITTPNSVAGEVSNLGSLTEFASEEPSFPATLEDAATEIRSGVLGESERKEITIGGVKGIEFIPKGLSSQGTERVDVVFVKNDTLYNIWLNTKNYDADKEGFDLIINTMEIQ